MDKNRRTRIGLAVAKKYSSIASGTHLGSCCGTVDTTLPASATEIALSCGSPLDYASPREGMTVLDLGSGGGIDVFAAAAKVGPSGRVVGVDSTAKMVARARRTAEENHYSNVEFRQGEMERLPVRSGTVDLIISNCAVNLVPNKQRAFREMLRVLRPGGRLTISDIIAERDLPSRTRHSMREWSRCIGGALTLLGLKRILTKVGFVDFKVLKKEDWAKGRAEGLPLSSVTFSAVKANVKSR